MIGAPKTKRWKSEKYLKFIREQPCIICCQRAEPHHVKVNKNAGMGRKPSDYYCLPVTRKYHQEWEANTNDYMEKKYGIDIYKELFFMTKKYIEIS